MAEAGESEKRPDPIDIHVGSRVRQRRMFMSLSQEKLGNQMGLTFQQIQKYEKGVNRIGASRLWQLATILKVSVEYFYDGMPGYQQPAHTPAGFGERHAEDFIQDFLSTREGLELNRAFVQIKSRKVRRHLVELIKSLNADEEAQPPISENGMIG
ncbi:MAG: helix-turn-helix transcriptional regulator [Pseudomonadota bacterium]